MKKSPTNGNGHGATTRDPCDAWIFYQTRAGRQHQLLTYLPACATMPPAVMVKVFRQAQELETFYVPLTHEPQLHPQDPDLALLRTTLARTLQRLEPAAT